VPTLNFLAGDEEAEEHEREDCRRGNREPLEGREDLERLQFVSAPRVRFHQGRTNQEENVDYGHNP
jgi:hypothetical protein